MVDVDDLAINTDISQTLIQYEMSRRELGPKLYGLNQGRIHRGIHRCSHTNE